MHTIFYQNFLTKEQSVSLLAAMEIDHALPKKKEIVQIVPAIGTRDYARISIQVSEHKSTYGKKLFHWKHYR